MERWLFPTAWIGQAVGGVMPDLHLHMKNPRKLVSHGLRQPPWCHLPVLSELPPERAEPGRNAPVPLARISLFCGVTLKTPPARQSITDNFADCSWK